MEDYRVPGSLDAMSDLEVNQGLEGLDAAAKNLLRHKEILTVILMHTCQEFEGYGASQVMDLIETSSVKREEVEVSTNRTNTVISQENTAFSPVHEKASYFDTLFRVCNPGLSDEKGFLVNLHINIEPQKDYTQMLLKRFLSLLIILKTMN